MSARRGLLIVALAACGSSRSSHLYPAGSAKDDGYGDLAQQSARLLTREGPDAVALALHRPRPRARAAYGGDAYGGAQDVGEVDAALVVPPADARPNRYRAVAGLTGSVEGVVTWRGAPPPALVTSCGTIESRPRAAGVAGVLVTIEPLATGRVLPSFARAASVGGTITKRGCRLAPALQIVTPLPANVAIHGDATPAELLVTLPAGAHPFALAAAGRVSFSAQRGVTRIESRDGSLAAAWIVAADTPYYAITDDDGRFRIGELAAGTYELTFWRPALPTISQGKLSYGAPVTIHRSLRIDAGRPAHLDLALAP